MSAALSLAAVGWVAEEPSGNRLRWSLPESAADAGRHIVPDTIVVERAPLDLKHDERAIKLFGPAALAAPGMWEQHGDVSLSGLIPVLEQFGRPVQAVRFLYSGMPALVHAFEGEHCVATQVLADGQWALLQAAAIDTLAITTQWCELQMLSTLDLYAPPPLPFEVIAEIDLEANGTAPFADAATRYPATPQLDDAKWGELQKLWAAAVAEPLGAESAEGAPSAWQELQVVLGARWEHAVLCGLGFVDGPDHAAPALDHWRSLLTAPRDLAYRVRDADGRLEPSNVICVPGAPAPELPVAPAPTIEQGAVRLGESGAMRASWEVAWGGLGPGSVGAEVVETVAVGGGSTTEAYAGRGRRPNAPPGTGFVHRDERVASHQVVVSASVRAQDGFDRIGPPGPASPPTPLAIDHHPQPPPLRGATTDGTTATLTQPPPVDWAPDALVAAAGGTVRFLRRVGDPARFSAPVLEVLPAGGLLAVKLEGAAPPDPSAFAGGRITIGALRGAVSLLAWPVAMVDVSHGDGPVAAAIPGATAEVSQSPADPALFVPVHELPASGLPEEIVFADPLPPPVTTQLLEYRAQIAFAGLLGPLGPAVQALRLPPTPEVPPPFAITTLGVDFYHRTVVQLELTNPSAEMLEVWWAEGSPPAADFSRRAVPGDAGVRHADGGRTLFDTLSLPIPSKVDRTVTIGVQAVNAADGRSDFATVTHTLPAA